MPVQAIEQTGNLVLYRRGPATAMQLAVYPLVDRLSLPPET